MNKYSNHDRYLDPSTGVLLNKLGITDAAELELQEAQYAASRSCEIVENPVNGTFDLAHLQAIHKALFSDVYEWAGELRTIDISKGESYFAHHAHLESAAQPIFANLAAENFLAGSDTEQFSERAAYYLGEINALHPFREGNGRTQREFINQLAHNNDYCIEWKNITREEMVQASIESFKGNPSQFAAFIHHNLCEIAAYGRQTTGDISSPQAEASTMQVPQAPSMDGADLDNIYDMTPNQQPAPPTQAQTLEAPQIEPPI